MTSLPVTVGGATRRIVPRALVARFDAGRGRVQVDMPTKEVTDYQLTVFDLSADQRRRAVTAVASAAHGADDCAELLDILGLGAAEAFPDVPAPRME